ncbi:MAG: hypothetical protein L0170_10495, partial [Acidobacteria bacterium]|nr:hypothetical protein [Acidobacteriota bacterium]
MMEKSLPFTLTILLAASSAGLAQTVPGTWSDPVSISMPGRFNPPGAITATDDPDLLAFLFPWDAVALYTYRISTREWTSKGPPPVPFGYEGTSGMTHV